MVMHEGGDQLGHARSEGQQGCHNHGLGSFRFRGSGPLSQAPAESASQGFRLMFDRDVGEQARGGGRCGQRGPHRRLQGMLRDVVYGGPFEAVRSAVVLHHAPDGQIDQHGADEKCGTLPCSQAAK